MTTNIVFIIFIITTSVYASFQLFSRSDAKSARKRTCEQLREYIHIPVDGYGSQNKLWVRQNYRRCSHEVVIVNGPCKEDIVLYLKKYLKPESVVIVLGTHVKSNLPAVEAIRSLLHVVKEDAHSGSLGFMVLKQL